MRTLAVLFALSVTAAAEPPKGFTALFDGKDLAGWHGWNVHEKNADPYSLDLLAPEKRAAKMAEWTVDVKKHWKALDGDLVNDGGGAYLATDKSYGDCELLIDYKILKNGDSGIYLRGMPQVQIWDPANDREKKNGADQGSGGLWNNAEGTPGRFPLVLADKPAGEWNHFRILMIGERVSIWLNDKLVVDHARLANFWDKKKPLPRATPIALQTHGGETRWRNIFIREIGSDEANKILAEKANAGLTSVFNGKDFDGWAGATANYEVEDGAIACKPKKGGNLYTKEKYADFTATLEIKLPPGGNNGIGIRYPGHGDGAYSGMCELQVLDDASEKYKHLNARQYHGSAYGMVASHRGYQRPVGEWNFQKITVSGPKIVVDLNGTQILDADLSKVKDFMDNQPHPGLALREGHFAFLGHNDPVRFRNVMIGKLESK